ncbi:MAG: hypothetical protein ACJ72N_16915 [Labedaea sp.]
MVEIACVKPGGDLIVGSTWQELLIDAVRVLGQVEFDEDLGAMPIDAQEPRKAMLGSEIRRHTIDVAIATGRQTQPATPDIGTPPGPTAGCIMCTVPASPLAYPGPPG